MDQADRRKIDLSLWEGDADADETHVPLAEKEAIETREDFGRFVEALRDDVRAHPTWWENNTLESYLDALAAVADSLHQGFKNRGQTLPEQPTWRIVADMLLAARIYSSSCYSLPTTRHGVHQSMNPGPNRHTAAP